ncbi:hypothetical protein AVEN_154920-1 [Araneus ventricosus]|uniref:Uncharacterized protein n=1 Tax=Araneus ventricosus TaxID=182803 RepID=A0A4Y2A7C3_ARAVE|nr:hypothetical protein AVEN_154920-1 [Araneus ventricosus]
MLKIKVSKTGHLQLFQNGIFGKREGKSNRQGRKSMKFGTNYSKRSISNELKIQDFMRRFQFETPMRGSGASKDMPTLRPRDEARKSKIRRVDGEGGNRRATVAHFGAYVNDVRNYFLIKIGGKKRS